MKKIFVVILFLLFCSYSFASTDIGDGQLLIVSQGEVLATAGGTSSSIGLSSVYLNPAFMANLSHKFTLNTGGFNGIFCENDQVIYVNLAMKPFSKMYLYLGYTSFGSENFTPADFDGTIIDQDHKISGNNLIKVGMAYNIINGLNMGFIFTNFSQYFPGFVGENDYKEDSMLLSFGLSYNIKKLKFGLSILNLSIKNGLENYYTDGNFNFTFGTSFFNNKLNLNVLISPLLRNSNNMRGGVALEYDINNLIFLRFAFIDAINQLSSGIYPGFGIKFKNFRFDYTFSFGEFTAYHYLSLTFGLKDLHPYTSPIPKKKKKVKKKAKSKKEVIVKKQFAKPAKKILVAVLDFEGKNMDSSNAGIITDFIRQDMINSGYFTVLERGAINSILKEVDFQQSGCTSAECAVQIGKVLAVRKMIVGSVSKLGKKYFIALRMVDVESSQIDVATSVGASVPIEDLPTYVNKLVSQMIESINSKK
ncbi:hypothetical protein J7L48_01770 [bacterium]|nr:hypothetical protein [bacterium]